MEGVEAIAAIRQEFLSARLIVLTTYDGDEDIYRGLRAGAKSYLLKDAPPDELLATIRAVHIGQTHLPTSCSELQTSRDKTANKAIWKPH